MISQCKTRIYSEGFTWQCPREPAQAGYCYIHYPEDLRFRIKFTWPEGLVRWCHEGSSLVSGYREASLYTLEQADDILRNKYKDARSVWGIITTKELSHES